MTLKTFLLLAFNVGAAGAFTARPLNHGQKINIINPTPFTHIPSLAFKSKMESPRNEKIHTMLATSEGDVYPEEVDAMDVLFSDIESLVEKNALDDGIDVVKAKAILAEVYEDLSYETSAIAAVSADVRGSGDDRTIVSPCADASFWLAVDVVVLFLCLTGLPAEISKGIAVKIVKKQRTKLVKEIKRIAIEYFQDASDLLSFANGLVEVIKLLGSLFSPSQLISIIVDDMNWGERFLWGAVVAANVALLFAASAPAIVVKLALLAGPIAGVVSSTVKVIQKCG